MFRRLLTFSLLLCFLSIFGLIDPAQALTVSPVKLELRGDPGATVGGTFQLINEQNEPLTFYVSYANFEAEGETGVPHFVDGTEGFATWIRLIPNEMNSVALEPGETVEVPYEVVIPESAEPGGYFGAIFWGSSPSDGNSAEALAVGAKVGILLFLTVNGEVEEAGGLLEFDTAEKARWFNHLPIQFYYRFRNDGGDRIMPQGILVIKNMFGMTTEVITANATESNILPSTVRRFEEAWGEELSFENPSFLEMAREQWRQMALGYYRAELTLTYGADAVTTQASSSFWVFPWQLLSLLAGALSITGILFRLGIRRYNQWIIRQALSIHEIKKGRSTIKKSQSKKH